MAKTGKRHKAEDLQKNGIPVNRSSNVSFTLDNANSSAKEMTVSAISVEPLWPAWGHDRKWAWRLESLEPLCVVAKSYLERGELHTVVILDAELRLLRVVDVREVGRAGLFGWRPGFKGIYLRVELNLQFEKQLTLDEAKKYMLEFLSAHPNIYTSAMSKSELSSALMSAGTSEELFIVL